MKRNFTVPRRNQALTSSGAPLLQIARVRRAPTRCTQHPSALMDDRYRPRAQPDIPQLRLAAEVQIVEVKIEALVEPQIVQMKRRTVGDQQQPVQQLDLVRQPPFVTRDADDLERPQAGPDVPNEFPFRLSCLHADRASRSVHWRTGDRTSVRIRTSNRVSHEGKSPALIRRCRKNTGEQEELQQVRRTAADEPRLNGLAQITRRGRQLVSEPAHC